jgi:alkylation response protein AidB-like acyl-CoA dehydrogenase
MLADAGYLNLLIPEDHGGAGLSAIELSLLMEQAGRHLVSAPVAQAAIVAWAISKIAKDDARMRWLEALTSGRTLILPATGDAGGGYALAGRRQPMVQQQPGKLAVTGSHSFIVSPFSSDAFLVAASMKDGESLAALLGSDDAGVSIVARPAIDGSKAMDLMLEAAPLAANAILATGEDAEGMLATIRELLVIANSAELLGIAQRAHEIACDHIKLRTQFGRPLGSNQVLQHRSVNDLVAIELLNSMQWQVATVFAANRAHPALIAALHVTAARTALAATRSAIQMLGAIGYTAEHVIGRLYRRVLVLSALHGGESGQRSAFARATELERIPFEHEEVPA